MHFRRGKRLSSRPPPTPAFVHPVSCQAHRGQHAHRGRKRCSPFKERQRRQQQQQQQPHRISSIRDRISGGAARWRHRGLKAEEGRERSRRGRRQPPLSGGGELGGAVVPLRSAERLQGQGQQLQGGDSRCGGEVQIVPPCADGCSLGDVFLRSSCGYHRVEHSGQLSCISAHKKQHER